MQVGIPYSLPATRYSLPLGSPYALWPVGTMVDHELNELKREFLAEADSKVREMRAALGSSSREALDRLAYLAHQLKGSGGSYGYAVISDNAAEIEKSAEKIATGEAAYAEVENTLQRCVQNLGSAIERSARELPA